MTRFARTFLAGVLAFLAATPLTATPARAAYSQPELEQMLAPVALYPDALLSQILMASTYPTEVLEAAQWSREHPGWQGDAAVQSVQHYDWDPSVKSLVAFPNVLARMAENHAWMQTLGDAFLTQEPQLMETVQSLRRRAHAAGQLVTNEHQLVYEDPQAITIVPANPQVVYVPYYDPRVVYGAWWWDGYPPVVWAPWPGYVRVYRPGLSAGLWWGTPVGISIGFFFGNINWAHRHVRVVHVDNYYVRPVRIRRAITVGPGHWRHDHFHRHGFGDRDRAAHPQVASPPSRHWQRRDLPLREAHSPRTETPRVAAPFAPYTAGAQPAPARQETTRAAHPRFGAARDSAALPQRDDPRHADRHSRESRHSPRSAERREEHRRSHAAGLESKPLATPGSAATPRGEPAQRAGPFFRAEERRAARPHTEHRGRHPQFR